MKLPPPFRLTPPETNKSHPWNTECWKMNFPFKKALLGRCELFVVGEYKTITIQNPIVHIIHPLYGRKSPSQQPIKDSLQTFQNPSWTHPQSFHRPTFHGYFLVQRSKAKGNVLPDRGGEKPWILWNHLTEWIYTNKTKQTPQEHTVHVKIPWNPHVGYKVGILWQC